MKARHVAVLAAASLLLHGCYWAPGQHQSMNSLMRSQEQNDRIDLVPITPKLIAMDRAAEATDVLPPELRDYKPESYRIGAGDSLYITVWEHPELTSPAGPQQQTQANGRVVRSDGTLYYPYVGELKVVGLTVEDLRKAISDKLAKYVENPQVDVNIVGYGSQRVTLEGAFVVTTPQPITVIPLTLGQSIGVATINTLQADLSDLVLTRDGHDYHIDLDALHNGKVTPPDIYLKPGDHLYLPFNDRQEAYVVGEVNRPMAVPFKTTDMTLTQAIGRAGGLNPNSAKGQAVYVIRAKKDSDEAKGTVYQLNARSPDAFILADQFKVKAGDVVFVGPAGVTRWNRFVTQLMPFNQIIGTAFNAQYDLHN